VLSTYRRLLRSSRPVMLMTALVALFGVSGTAVAAKRLVTGADIKNGSITSVDLAKSTHDALQGKKGDSGSKGAGGARGVVGARGARGYSGAIGSQGAAGSNGLNGNQGIQGATGSPGTDGTNGTNGTDGAQGIPGIAAVRYFATVASDGTLSTSRVSGVSQASETSNGLYHLSLTGAPDTSRCVAVAEVNGVPGIAFAVPDGSGNVAVTTFGANGVQTARDFVVTVSC
jgi:Collagen triple helix repeat (20 copies)